MTLGREGLRAVGGEERWDGLAALDQQAEVELRADLSWKKPAELIELIVALQDAIGETYGALLASEVTLRWAQEVGRRLPAGKYPFIDGNLILQGRLDDVRAAMAQCQRALRLLETDGAA